MKLRFFVIGLLLLALPVMAQQNDTNDDVLNSITQDDLELIKSTYNENIDQVPSTIKTLIGNEKINLILEGTEFAAYFVTSDGLIEEVGLDRLDDPTINLVVDEFAQNEIFNGNVESGDDFLNLYEDGHITIDPVGFWSNIKIQAVKTVLFFRSLFT